MGINYNVRGLARGFSGQNWDVALDGFLPDAVISVEPSRTRAVYLPMSEGRLHLLLVGTVQAFGWLCWAGLVQYRQPLHVRPLLRWEARCLSQSHNKRGNTDLSYRTILEITTR